MPGLHKPSSIPAVFAKLYDLFTEAVDDDVTVTYGRPGDGDWDQQLVAITGAENDDEWASIGFQSREENYTVAIVVICKKPGGTAREAVEGAFALLETINAPLIASPQLYELQGAAGSGVVQSLLKVQKIDDYFDDNARSAVITAGLKVQARI